MRRCVGVEVTTSVMRAVWSPEAVTRRVSSKDHLMSNIPFWCGMETMRCGSVGVLESEEREGGGAGD